MVQGIETFKEWFEGYAGRFVIIGGTACNYIYAHYGAPERATQDIDMVIVAEAFDAQFFGRFVAFIRAGGYQHRDSSGKYELYRFERPTNEMFPPKIELLSKRPECLRGIDAHLGRFGTVDAGGSLSAILLDDAYYRLVEGGTVVLAALACNAG